MWDIQLFKLNFDDLEVKAVSAAATHRASQDAKAMQFL